LYQLYSLWSGIFSGREKEDPNNTVSGSAKEQPTNNSFHNIAYGKCSYLVSCDCGSFLSTNTTKHIFKGFFQKWNLFLKNFESSDYCDCILYLHKCQRQVTNGSHGKYLAFALYSMRNMRISSNLLPSLNTNSTYKYYMFILWNTTLNFLI
jgi:hypothetical protein